MGVGSPTGHVATCPRGAVDDELPHVAAQWLAQGLDGPRLRELAGVKQAELPILDGRLLRDALSEAGVVAGNVPARRTAAPFLARAAGGRARAPRARAPPRFP